jgi:hypothetical protein
MKQKVLGSVVAAVAGALSKIWSVVVAPVYWWEKQKTAAALVLVTAGLGVVINFSPAVQAVSQTSGLHTETLTGSLLGLWRALRRTNLQITRTATAYIEAPSWAPLLNLLIGALLALTALRVLRQPFTWRQGWRLVGSLTIAGVVASPFLSTQYVSWFTPFAALARRTTILMVGMSILSLIVILGWFDQFDGAVWWWASLCFRNALLIWLGLALVKRAEPTHQGDAVIARSTQEAR